MNDCNLNPLFIFRLLLVATVVAIFTFLRNFEQCISNYGASVTMDAQRVLGRTESSSGMTLTCKGFFAVLAAAFVPPAPDQNDNETCGRLYSSNIRELLLDHSQHMVKMNSSLTLFTTWTKEQMQDPRCSLTPEDFPGIRTQQFDPIALLQKYNFSENQIEWITHWFDAKTDHKRMKLKIHSIAARLTDVWRILLAREYQFAYCELDMILLSEYPEVYLAEPNVAVPIWGEELGAFEIQNSGFCFNTDQLDVLIRNVKKKLDEKGDQQVIENNYNLYTEMGELSLIEAMVSLCCTIKL